MRFDTAIFQDYRIPPFYDSMIGKLIVYAKSRDEAIRKMRAALSELVIDGVGSNIEQQLKLQTRQEFITVSYCTNLLEKTEG